MGCGRFNNQGRSQLSYLVLIQTARWRRRWHHPSKRRIGIDGGQLRTCHQMNVFSFGCHPLSSLSPELAIVVYSDANKNDEMKKMKNRGRLFSPCFKKNFFFFGKKWVYNEMADSAFSLKLVSSFVISSSCPIRIVCLEGNPRMISTLLLVRHGRHHQAM